MSESTERPPAKGPEAALARAQAEYATFTDGFRSVVLGTVGKDGEPLASYAPCVVDARRRIVCFVSGMSEHSATLEATRRASAMFLEDEAAAQQVFARRRLTYACAVEILTREHAEFAALAEAFVARFGGIAEQITAMGDFRAVRLTPESGRFVIGFGAAYTIDGSDLERLVPLRGAGHGHGGGGHAGAHGHGPHGGGHGAAHGGGGHAHGAPPTPLGADGKLPAAAEARIVEHMNADHAEALLRYAHVLAGRSDVESASLRGLDARGLDLRVVAGGREETLRIDFDEPLASVDDARTTLVRLAQRTSAGA
ncbi:MAG: DUF2470 domain-containing protein [Planctomycetes bacterium]|nr:DUF2470 domain-containing protein [Planctomycetota bacterium]